MALGLLTALWLIFTESFNLQELLVGAVTIGMTLAFTVFIVATYPLHATFRASDIAQCWRIPSAMVVDTWTATRVLALDLLRGTPIQSSYGVCSFRTEEKDNDAHGRSVLATAYSSTTPNSIVIGIDVPRRRLLLHQLVRTELSQMLRNLGAKA